MKEIPILFGTEMVQAIIEGRKTQTRRLKFRGKPGDILWVKETWKLAHTGDFIYRATIKPEDKELAELPIKWGWKPSLFMPKEACRLRLRATAVREERLLDISLPDVVTEGFSSRDAFFQYWDSLNADKGCGTDKNPLVCVISFEAAND